MSCRAGIDAKDLSARSITDRAAASVVGEIVVENAATSKLKPKKSNENLVVVRKLHATNPMRTLWCTEHQPVSPVVQVQ